MNKRKSANPDDALFEQACPVCKAEISLDPAMAGHKAQCPKCLNEFTCEKTAAEVALEESPAPRPATGRLSAADRNLREQVRQLKQETADLATRIEQLQKENARTLADNTELRRRLESAQSALQEFSRSVLTLIEIQESINQMGPREKSSETKGPDPEPEERASFRAATKK